MASKPFKGKFYGAASVNTTAHLTAIKCDENFVKRMTGLVPRLGLEMPEYRAQGMDPYVVVAEFHLDKEAGTFQLSAKYTYGIDNPYNFKYDSGPVPFNKVVKDNSFIHGRPVEMILFKISDTEILMYRRCDDYWLDTTFRLLEDMVILDMMGNGVSSIEYYKRMP